MKIKRKINTDRTLSLLFSIEGVPYEVVVVPPEFSVTTVLKRESVVFNTWNMLSIADLPADEQISISRECRALKKQYAELKKK